jgi:hypothetical protein
MVHMTYQPLHQHLIRDTQRTIRVRVNRRFGRS